MRNFKNAQRFTANGMRHAKTGHAKNRIAHAGVQRSLGYVANHLLAMVENQHPVGKGFSRGKIV